MWRHDVGPPTHTGVAPERRRGRRHRTSGHAVGDETAFGADGAVAAGSCPLVVRLSRWTAASGRSSTSSASGPTTGCWRSAAGTVSRRPLVCDWLDGGRLTAIDRSATMIDAARRRNAAYVEQGMAEFLVGSLEEIDLGERRFDLILAVRVGLFHRDPDRARRLASTWLVPEGRILVFYDPPSPRR